VTERTDLARRIISLIDLTDLADDRSPDEIPDLCDRATEHGTAAVCVWPEYVSVCRERLAGTGVRVATVVNFPSGAEPVEQVLAATSQALADGADDIDLVLPYETFLDGETLAAGMVVAAVAELITPPVLLKVILESGALGGPEVVLAAARLAVEHGADFVKTSTGKISAGASLESAAAMLQAIAEADRPIGIKPSGGIRTFDDAVAYLDLADTAMGQGWATPATFRFGASGLLDALVAAIDGDPDGGSTGAGSY
jgi:deoxyribose-phosphate aldolase